MTGSGSHCHPASVRFHRLHGPWVNALVLLLLAVLTVLPVGFLYPNLAPRPWRGPALVGAILWLGMLLWLLRDYPEAPSGLVWLSLLYPAFYFGLSFRLGPERGAPPAVDADQSPAPF